MRATYLLSLFTLLVLGASASPTPIHPDLISAPEPALDSAPQLQVIEPVAAAHQPRTHVYTRRPRAHP
ncbi:hypothetical protein CERSUDRAFT_114725 [Gelatoporia subvermispora B]|uniref:Uncharacterized protein n=1 Tax=Ceriporiopsis subvermispora (strain B) TaxID=914234 RepID=M2PKJ9_CERS8|nr:hypothetical protein CERSUDRAFT_114725 [Gelatoporia subvermispora B]